MPPAQTFQETIHMRPAASTDDALLFALFAEDKRVEFAAVGLPAEQAELLIKTQYRGRSMSYTSRYPQTEQWILCTEDGTAAGQLLLHRQSQRWRIVDIAVATAHRGQGLGTKALREVQERCRQAAVCLELSVTSQNPARRLYERLGFHATGQSALEVEMAWNDMQERVTDAGIQ